MALTPIVFIGITSAFFLGLPSLLSRFQGSLLGRSWFLTQRATVSVPNPQQLALDLPPLERPLLNRPPLDRADLYRRVEQAVLQSQGDVQGIVQNLAQDVPTMMRTSPGASLDDRLLALVPLILYGHETPKRLRSQLQVLSQAWPDPWERVLQGWATIISQLLSISVAVSLEQVGTWAEAIGHPEIREGLNRGQSLTQLRAQVNAQPCPALAIALYCFGTTPDASALTLARAQQHSPAAGALALTLSGAYRGWVGLPQRISRPDDPAVLTGLTLAQQLWQHWLGVYLPPAHASPLEGFGAAQTLQPRSGRVLISLVDP